MEIPKSYFCQKALPGQLHFNGQFHIFDDSDEIIHLTCAGIQVTQAQKHIVPLRISKTFTSTAYFLLFKRQIRQISRGEKFLECPVKKSNIR